jgi:hypothetical protein
MVNCELKNYLPHLVFEMIFMGHAEELLLNFSGVGTVQMLYFY